MWASSKYHLRPTWPRRHRRRSSARAGAHFASQSRTASWLNAMPPTTVSARARAPLASSEIAWGDRVLSRVALLDLYGGPDRPLYARCDDKVAALGWSGVGDDLSDRAKRIDDSSTGGIGHET